MTRYTESPTGLMVPRGRALDRTDAIVAYAVRAELAESRLAQLEQQIAEDGWTRLGGEGGREFSRATLDNITELCRIMYLKNPLIRRAVEIGALYVWGQDLAINAADDTVELAVDRWWRDNATTLTGQQASRLLEVELEVTGNVFLVLFPDAIEGRVRVRTCPVEEIREIISNPEDRADIWYYRRKWSQQGAGANVVDHEALYPDWRYRPADRPETVVVGSTTLPVRWGSPIYHVRAGAYPHWRWGVSEVYAASDWARAYKGTLEDDATRSRALAKWAFRVTTDGGKAAVDAATARLNTTLGRPSGETNPAPPAGSAFVGDKSIGFDPIRLSGATLDPDHSRPVRLMASAALGIPDHFFDADVGNYATASTMDRPTELRFNERRQLWRDVFGDLIGYLVDQDLAATRGLIARSIAEPDRAVDLSWPDLLERSVTERVGAVNTAAPYLPKELTAKLIMQALGVEDIDGELAKLQDQQDDAAAAQAPQREAFVAALRELREAIRAQPR